MNLIRAPPASSGHVTAVNKEARRVFEYKAPSTAVNPQVKGELVDTGKTYLIVSVLNRSIHVCLLLLNSVACRRQL